MLLRDVVWLGIASKLSLFSPYTTLLRDVVWLGIVSKLSLLSPYTTLLRDVVWFGIASKLTLLSPYTTLRSISSLFGYSLSPLLERRQSEPGAKAERTQNVSRPSVIIIPKRTKIRVPLLRKNTLRSAPIAAQGA